MFFLFSTYVTSFCSSGSTSEVIMLVFTILLPTKFSERDYVPYSIETLQYVRLGICKDLDLSGFGSLRTWIIQGSSLSGFGSLRIRISQDQIGCASVRIWICQDLDHSGFGSIKIRICQDSDLSGFGSRGIT